ncbi:MAG: DNA translocase FtsK [Lachnospiraceae bacterium]|nr:DNA translocase FtsK [Lachnospiraceae bacterium]
MASKPKNTTKRKNTRSTGGRNTSGKKQNNTKNKNQEVSFGSEVTLLIILALCIVMFLSNFGIGGFVGAKVSAYCFGVFGMSAYIFPICFFIGAAFFVSNRDNGAALVKIVAGVVFVAFLCLFMELVAGDSTDYQVKKSFQYAMEHKSGGGALGGVLAMILCPAIGKIGTYVVDVIALIIALVLLTEQSFLGGVKKRSRRVYNTAREDAARRREIKESRREEQMHRRMDKKVEGVALDTRIQPIKPKLSDNISELKPPTETEMFSQELKEKLFSDQKENIPKKPVSSAAVPDVSVLGIKAKEETKQDKSNMKEPGIMVSPETSQSQEMISEPVVVEKVHKKPRRSSLISERNQEALERTEEGWQTDTSEGEILLAREEPVIITSEPSGITGSEDMNWLDDITVSDEVIAGLEAAIISGAEEKQEPESEFKIEEMEPVIPELSEKIEEVTRFTESEYEKSEREEETGRAEIEEGKAVENRIEKTEIPKTVREVKPPYVMPPVALLKKGSDTQGDSRKHLQETALKLQQTLKNFGVNVTITDVSCGPSVTRYEMQPEMGVKVSKIVNLADDIKLNLAAADIRIEAPIPGKAAVGIEVPNKETVMVRFRDMIESEEFQNHKSNICFTAGKDIGGEAIVADIAKMPHLLIAGATGSGKSVCINTIIMSILYKADPEDVKLILIDPKVVELSVYNGIPHLLIPVVTDPKKAAGALHWAVAEMMDRYQKFADCQVRDLKGYNQKIAGIKDVEDETKPEKMPQIVVVVDELADLMMVAPGDVEDAICRLAQLARAAGIHLIIATQRPSVDVITGLIKANMPSRIAFSVSSGVDSRTILDMNGAEKLLGNGDMLFYPQGYQKPLRVQGPFVSDPEVEAVVDFLKKQSTVVYNSEIEEKMNTVSVGAVSGSGGGGNERDAYFVEAGKFIIEKEKGSIGMLQRMFKVGFNRAARIMDQLEEAGVVGPEEGTKPRRVQMSMEEFETYVEEHV